MHFALTMRTKISDWKGAHVEAIKNEETAAPYYVFYFSLRASCAAGDIVSRRRE